MGPASKFDGSAILDQARALVAELESGNSDAAESLIDEHWITVDPTLAQLPADATHIKFVEGESFLELMPLVDLVGQLQIQIIAVESS